MVPDLIELVASSTSFSFQLRQGRDFSRPCLKERDQGIISNKYKTKLSIGNMEQGKGASNV